MNPLDLLISQVGKISEQLSDSVLELVFTDTDLSGKADTIRVSLLRDIPKRLPVDNPVTVNTETSVVNDTMSVTGKSAKEDTGLATVVPITENTSVR